MRGDPNEQGASMMRGAGSVSPALDSDLTCLAKPGISLRFVDGSFQLVLAKEAVRDLTLDEIMAAVGAVNALHESWAGREGANAADPAEDPLPRIDPASLAAESNFYRDGEHLVDRRLVDDKPPCGCLGKAAPPDAEDPEPDDVLDLAYRLALAVLERE